MYVPLLSVTGKHWLAADVVDYCWRHAHTTLDVYLLVGVISLCNALRARRGGGLPGGGGALPVGPHDLLLSPPRRRVELTEPPPSRSASSCCIALAKPDPVLRFSTSLADDAVESPLTPLELCPGLDHATLPVITRCMPLSSCGRSSLSRMQSPDGNSSSAADQICSATTRLVYYSLSFGWLLPRKVDVSHHCLSPSRCEQLLPWHKKHVVVLHASHQNTQRPVYTSHPNRRVPRQITSCYDPTNVCRGFTSKRSLDRREDLLWCVGLQTAGCKCDVYSGDIFQEAPFTTKITNLHETVPCAEPLAGGTATERLPVSCFEPSPVWSRKKGCLLLAFERIRSRDRFHLLIIWSAKQEAPLTYCIDCDSWHHR